jgi:hypothetical protein
LNHSKADSVIPLDSTSSKFALADALAKIVPLPLPIKSVTGTVFVLTVRLASVAEKS